MLENIILALSVFILLLSVFYSAQIILGTFNFNQSDKIALSNGDVSFKVAIPAHNEEKVLGKTIANILTRGAKASDILVIADNCSDNTANVAIKYGVRVIERKSESKKGKGYALNLAIQTLKNDAPEVLIFIDADCLIKTGNLQALANIAIEKNSPLQATYLMKACESQLSSKVGALAFWVKNHIRPNGLKKMGLPCHITGSGIAVPYTLLEKINLESGNIVEDMQMGLDFARQGIFTIYTDKMLIESDFPEIPDDLDNQRKRWEVGHIQTIKSQFLPLILSAMESFSIKKLLFSLDLLIPPLVLFLISLGVFFLFAILYAFFYQEYSILYLASSALLLPFFSIFICWLTLGRRYIGVGDLKAVPTYAVSKLGNYVSIFKRTKMEWNKTSRAKNEDEL